MKNLHFQYQNNLQETWTMLVSKKPSVCVLVFEIQRCLEQSCHKIKVVEDPIRYLNHQRFSAFAQNSGNRWVKTGSSRNLREFLTKLRGVHSSHSWLFVNVVKPQRKLCHIRDYLCEILSAYFFSWKNHYSRFSKKMHFFTGDIYLFWL